MKAEELAALGQHKMAKVFDVILLLALIGFFTVIPHVSRMLYMGDWDFWVDWKDKLWWPIAGPSSALLVTAVGHYLAWYYLRLPLGATFTAVFVLIGAWLSRIFSFYSMEYYPINFIWPATTIPMALALDLILFWSRSYLVTSLIGGFLMGFSLLSRELADAHALPAAGDAVWQDLYHCRFDGLLLHPPPDPGILAPD